MARFMVHLENKSFEPMDAKPILRQARSLCSGIDATVRDARVSKKYVEYDITVPADEIGEIASRLKPIGPLDHAQLIVDASIEKEDAVNLGISRFNDERFWEAHEVLEGVWKNALEGERDLVQGIILVAAAFVHHQKFEDRICISIMARARDKLANSGGAYFGIDIDRLRAKISEIIDAGAVATFAI